MTTAQKPDALPVVAWRYKTAHTTHLCHSRLDHYFSNDEGETYIKGDALVLQADHEASLFAKEAEIAAVLPGSYYLDMPDGGSPSILTQLQRMAEDAARYRWLRDPQRCEAVGKEPYVGIDDDDAHPNLWALNGEKADAAIDAARAAADQGGA